MAFVLLELYDCMEFTILSEKKTTDSYDRSIMYVKGSSYHVSD